MPSACFNGNQHLTTHYASLDSGDSLAFNFWIYANSLTA